MLRALTAAEMRSADRITIEERGIPSLVLMECAAQAVLRELRAAIPGLARERVLVLCGKGNNGGDGLALARQLLQLWPRLDLTVAVLAARDALSRDARANWDMLAGQDFRAEEVVSSDSWAELLPRVADVTLVVDALLGTGLRGPARGLLARVIADVNAGFRRAKVVAVDMPSGLGSDAAAVLGPAMRADMTVTFTAPKASQVLGPACERLGSLSVARIGTAGSVLEALPGPRLLLSEGADAAEYAAGRERSSHKGSYGHVLAIGGSVSKPGAILMAATAALRAGAGLVTAVTAAGAAGAIVGTTPELMVEPAAALPDGTLGPASFDAGWFAGKTVVAIGPGLGTSEAGAALVRRVVQECSLPLVIDADGLAAVRGLDLGSRPAPAVLTPHPGEMGRLLGMTAAEVQRDRIAAVRQLAAASGACAVLKGDRSLIADPGGDVVVNPTGTPGMATAGSGDILTGMVSGLLAQFPRRPTLRTVAAAVYWHGLAGELAAGELGEQGMLATDIARHLKDALDMVRA